MAKKRTATPTRCGLTFWFYSTYTSVAIRQHCSEWRVYYTQQLKLSSSKRRSACTSVVHRNNRSLLASYWLRNRRSVAVKGTPDRISSSLWPELAAACTIRMPLTSIYVQFYAVGRNRTSLKASASVKESNVHDARFDVAQYPQILRNGALFHVTNHVYVYRFH